MVVDRDTQVAQVIDVNYFPGYNGMSGFHEALVAYLLRLVRPGMDVALLPALPLDWHCWRCTA